MKVPQLYTFYSDITSGKGVCMIYRTQILCPLKTCKPFLKRLLELPDTGLSKIVHEECIGDDKPEKELFILESSEPDFIFNAMNAMLLFGAVSTCASIHDGTLNKAGREVVCYSYI